MDFRLSDEEKMVCTAARQFGQKWGPKMPALREATVHDGVFDRAYFTELAEIGFAGALLPEAYGGSDMGLVPLALGMEELSRNDAGTALLMLTQMNALTILKAGPDAARDRYLKAIAAGEMIMAFAITEPDAGSNSFAMKTCTSRKGDQLVLNGTKTFITGVDVADKVLVISRSMPDAVRKEKGLPKTAGFNVVVIDRDAPGFTKTKLPTDGIEGLTQWTLHFDDVPVEELVGEEHMGIKPMFDVLNAERVLAAAQAVGMSQRLLDLAVEYAKERKVFGDRAIGSYQAIQHPLAAIKAELEAVRLLFYKAATMFDQEPGSRELGPLSTMAKYLAGEVAIKAADAALQTHGGSGFSREVGLIQAYVDARLLRTAPISREMVLNQVAEHVLGLPRSY